MRKRLLMSAVYLLFASFLIGLNSPQDRNIKIVAKTADGKPLPLYNASYALVVGVANYTNGWRKLDEAVNDAREVRTTLVQHGFIVTLVEDPTAVQLRDAIENFLSTYGLNKEARLLFYFAGHGHTQTFDYGGDMGYIVPTDAPHPTKDPAGFLRKALSMESFSSYARNFNAKHGLFLFDSCFSGSIFALSREALPDAITYNTSQPVRQFITAGSANETVPDKSIFKQQLLAALAGEGDTNHDGYVTGDELGLFLRTKVINYSRNAQHPQYGKIRDPYLDKGDFVFVVPLALPPTTAFDLSRYETEANRLATAKTEWDKWQSGMNASYQKTQILDNNANLTASSKAQMWQDFLAGYTNDNPYSNEDETMRREANNRQNYWRGYQPPKVEPAQPLRTANGDDEMVLIPAGSFMMGSKDGDDDEKPAHEVYVDAFYMDIKEVTVEKFKKFIDAAGYKTDAEKEGWSYAWTGSTWEKKQGVNWRHDPKGELAGNSYPVIHVSWNDAAEYCNWLSKSTGSKYRLPTEAEWEYAARCGSKGYKYSWGNGDPAGKKGGNIADEAAKRAFNWSGIWQGYDDGYAYTAPVGSFAPNDFGLYDMTGNVWEWCSDWYDSEYYKNFQNTTARNPKGPSTGTQRVLRGGSWYGNTSMRCAIRSRNGPTGRYIYVGFRCVRDVR